MSKVKLRMITQLRIMLDAANEFIAMAEREDHCTLQMEQTAQELCDRIQELTK